MAIREKYFIPDNIYFITFTILDWKKIFTTKNYCNLIYKWFDYTKEKYGNKIYGYVIMPNHIHVLMYITKQSPAISKLIQNAKRFLAYEIVSLLKKENNVEMLNFFTANANIKKRAKHKIFADRFDSKLVDANLFWEKLRYIHNNPCQERWHLSETPEEYKYSSASNYILGSGLYDVEVVSG